MAHNTKYRFFFTAEQEANISNFIQGVTPEPVQMAELEISPSEADEIACLIEDGYALDIVPPKGDPPAECER